MKKFILLLLCVGVMLGLDGCQFEMVSPDNLIAPPASNEEKIKQKKIISTVLLADTSLTMTMPDNMDEPQAFVVADVDGDELEEMVAFYTNSDNAFEQGFAIIKQNVEEKDSWYVAQQVSETGDNIDYFSLSDLDNDGQNELLFGVNSWGAKYLYCYTLENGRWELLARIQYDRLALIRMAEENQLVTITSDVNNNPPTSQVNLYTLRGVDKEVTNVYSTTIRGYCTSVVCGRFTHDKQGIGLVMQHNQYSTVVLILAETAGYQVVLEEPLSYDYASGQDLPIFRDINNDRIQEICYLLPPVDSIGNHRVSEYLRVWYQWQEDMGLQSIQASFVSIQNGYEFMIPAQWIDQIEYSFSKEQAIDWTDIYWRTDAQGKAINLFSIAAIDTYTWENSSSLDKNHIIVLGNNPNKNKMYIARLGADLPNDIAITENQLIAGLRIEGGR